MPCFRGTYFAKAFVLTSHSTGNPVDISGWEFRAMIRDRLDTEVLLELTTAGGGFVVTDGPNGEFEMRIPKEDTAELPVAKVVMDVLRTDAVPGPLWLFAAKFPVKEPVTRDDDD